MNPLKWIPAPYNWLAALVAILLVVVVIMTMGARIGAFFSDPFGWKAAGQAQDRSDARSLPHAQAASEAAAQAGDAFNDRKSGRDALGQENRDDVLSQPDAGSDAGLAGDVGLRGLCRRPSYADSPRCVQLRKADTAVDPR